MACVDRISLLIALAAAVGAVSMASTRAATILAPPDDFVMVSDDTTRTSLGTVQHNSLTDPYVARSRADASQDALQIATFLQYDLSGIAPFQVNDPGFSAAFRIDYTQRLNTANALAIFLGRNISGTWDSGGSNFPLHDWGFDDEFPGVIADDGVQLLSNVRTQNPRIDDLTVDVSGIVSNWVNGVYANQGFVLTYDRNAYQGAGFDNPELILNLVPEPATATLLLLALAPFLCRRPHRKRR